jgi:RNase H-fold protein (predicted Holliday junction resolvase)
MGKSNKSKDVNFPRKQTADGKPNPKYVDILEVDKPISGQNFGCFSFITPTKILKQKEMFFFEEFLKKWEMNKSMEKFHQFLNFVSYKYKINFEDLSKDFEGFVKEERETIISSSIEDDYKTFIDQNEAELDKQFNTKHNFQTSVCGFKARGNFATQEEAELRCKMLREVDPNFDIFVGPVGEWLPWDPECEQVPEQEYQEGMLNDLVKKYKENLESKDDMYEKLKEERVRKAKEEIAAKKELLKKENVAVQETREEDVKNIEKLRDIVD